MAKEKQPTGFWNTLSAAASDWWSGKKDAPRPPSRIPAVDPRTGNRTRPSPDIGASEAAGNVWRELQRSNFGANYLRDLAKDVSGGVSRVVRNPRAAYEGLASVGNAVQQILDAREFEQTGKWPQSTFSKLMPPKQLAAWRNQATQRYRTIAATYSYIDPKTNQRTMDWEGVQRAMSNDPVGTLAPIFGAVGGASGKASGFLKAAAEADAAAGKTKLAKVGNVAAQGYRGIQMASDVAARALNPAGSALAVAAKPVVTAAQRMRGPKVLDEAGNYTPAMQKAMRDQGYDPDVYSTPEIKAHFQEVIGKNGITPASIRKAVGTSQGIPVTRSMAMGERPPAEFAPDVAAARQQGQQYINQQMGGQFGAGPEERDLGSAFARSYVNGKNEVEGAYSRAFSHEGTFTNTDNFTAGVQEAINRELGEMGLDLNTVMSAPRFAQSQNALGGFRRGDRRFGGVFNQFDELAGAGPSKGLQATDLSGEVHTFDPASGQWMNASGQPVRAPGKISYLDAISDRANLPPPSSAQNGLTPRNIDGVRRDVNSFYNEAKTPEDKAVLSAINRGIDNYIETNAPNFTGDGAALSRDLQNARAANIQFIQSFDKSPNKVIRDASKITASNIALDENGALRFTGDPQNITAHLENRIIDPKTLQSRTNYTGGNTVTGDTVFRDLYNVFDPDGQNALVSHMRNTVANSPADPAAITTFIKDSPFFSPAEQEAAIRFQNARGIATETPLNPSTMSQGTGTRWGMRFSAPIIGQQIGQSIGGMFGPVGAGIGSTVGMMAGSAAEGKFEGLTRKGREAMELNGLPKAPVPEPHLFNPLTAATAVTGATGQNLFQQQPEPQPQPKPALPAPVTPVQAERDPYALPSSFAPPAPARPQPQGNERDPYALPPGFEPPKEDPYALPESFAPQRAAGGRAAYKSGGAVTDIEPLVRNLMNRAAQAKKMTNKDTEVLLNSHDDAIASALEVAQKSI